MRQVPFRVMCLKPATFNFTTGQELTSPVEVGSEYVVIELYDGSKGLCYFLEGQDPQNAFLARCFATLPDTSEEVGIEAEQEAIIYQR